MRDKRTMQGLKRGETGWTLETTRLASKLARVLEVQKTKNKN